MEVKKFKWADKYTVEFSTDENDIKIATYDKPEKKLFKIMSDLLKVAFDYFGYVSEGTFYSLSITGKEDKKSRLVIEIPTKVLSEKARVTFPPVPMWTVFDKNMEPIPDHPRNIYNNVLRVFIAQVEEFASGARSQMVLPFDEESQVASDKITKFPEMAK